MRNKYNLGVCEIFHTNIHGFTNNSYKYIHGHYMILSIIHKSDFYTMCIRDCIHDYINSVYRYYNINNHKLIHHPNIRNYNNIISNKNNIKLNIIQIINLSTNENIAIIKTFWLKILQRKFKKKYKNRLIKLEKMKNIRYLIQREILGK